VSQQVVTPSGGVSNVTIEVRDGPSVLVTFDTLAGSAYICVSNMRIVQGSQQLTLVLFPSGPNEAAVDLSLCDTLGSGVAKTVTITRFPWWFDANQDFALAWSSGVTIDVP
jgi:hypothetical protein